jgi:hypothetical protein
MAVDTRNKRASVVNVSLPWRGIWPTPDGTIDRQDRSEALGLYDGISFVASTAGVLSVTEGADASSFAGTVKISGTLARTEGADVAALTGQVKISGTLSVTEGADRAQFDDFIAGPLAAVEGADTASFRVAIPYPRIRQEREPVYLLELQVYDSNTLTLVTKYLSTLTICTSPTDTPANTEYLGRIVNAGKIERSMFSNGQTVGKATTNPGYFELNNADGALDAWLDYAVGGWSFTLKVLADKDDHVSTATTVFVGTMRGFASVDMRKTIQLRIRDKLETLDRPLLTERYAGSTNSTGATAEGDTNMSRQIKPYSLGFTYQVPAVPANSFDLIYQGALNAQGTMFAYDGGVLLTPAGPPDYATLAALQGATTGASGSGAAIEAGEYATCLALGFVRLAAKPAKTMMLELRNSTTESNNSVGFVAKQMLLYSGVSTADINTASFDALTSASGNWRCGIFVNDQSTVIDAVSKILNSVGATLISTTDGKFKAVSLGVVPDSLTFNPIFDDETPVDTFTNDDLSADSQFMLQASPQAEGDGVPAWACNVKYVKHWQTMSPADLNSSVSPANVEFYGKEFIETASGSSLILNAQPLAQMLDFELLLVTGTGGLIQSMRRFDYYGKRRDYLTFSVPAARAAGRDLGDIITVKPTDGSGNPRFGYGSSGKKMCMIGMTITYGSPSIEITAWG